MVSGLIISGMTPAIIFVTYLSDIFLTIKSKYKIKDGKNPKLDLKLANYVSTIGAVFMFSSPIFVRRIGAKLYAKYGYRY